MSYRIDSKEPDGEGGVLITTQSDPMHAGGDGWEFDAHIPSDEFQLGKPKHRGPFARRRVQRHTHVVHGFVQQEGHESYTDAGTVNSLVPVEPGTTARITGRRLRIYPPKH